MLFEIQQISKNKLVATMMKYDVDGDSWTMQGGGSATTNLAGVYGTRGVSNASNMPVPEISPSSATPWYGVGTNA